MSSGEGPPDNRREMVLRPSVSVVDCKQGIGEVNGLLSGIGMRKCGRWFMDIPTLSQAVAKTVVEQLGWRLAVSASDADIVWSDPSTGSYQASTLQARKKRQVC